MIFFLFIK